jgi:hypothetical protein
MAEHFDTSLKPEVMDYCMRKRAEATARIEAEVIRRIAADRMPAYRHRAFMAEHRDHLDFNWFYEIYSDCPIRLVGRPISTMPPLQALHDRLPTVPQLWQPYLDARDSAGDMDQAAGVVFRTRDTKGMWVLHDWVVMAPHLPGSATRIAVGGGYVLLTGMKSFLVGLKALWTPEYGPLKV